VENAEEEENFFEGNKNEASSKRDQKITSLLFEGCFEKWGGIRMELFPTLYVLT
jgi:hypothetical protein